MIEFRPIMLEDAEWINRCRDIEKNPFSALTFQSLYTWQREYGLTIAGDDDFFVIRSVENQGYFAPCGDGEKCRRFLQEAFKREGKQRVLYLTKEQAEMAASDGYRMETAPYLSEYICSTPALALKSGHVSATYRKKCRRFAEKFPYTVKRIEPEDIRELLGVIEDWEREFGGKEPLDLDAARLSLENFDALGLRGIMLRTNEEGMIAFSFGFESTPDIYTMSTVKYDRRLSASVTVVCTHEEARLVAKDYPFCNLEEDLGLKGLRDAKLQCAPVAMNEVFMIEK